MKKPISSFLLSECMSYDDASGEIRWKHRPKTHFPSNSAWLKFNDKFAGRVTGCLHHGYLRTCLTIDGEQHYLYAHRVAWCLKTGAWPTLDIDHIDGDGTNNKWANLREATAQQNHRNTPVRSHSQTGIKGVSRRKNGNFAARITIDKKSIHLGCFSNAMDAGRAFAERALLEHGEFTHQSIRPGASK